ncbi:MAG TPA: M13 family metallopeptidase N-terminal domain-containing protein, partial [Myxococcaceae bacterium]
MPIRTFAVPLLALALGCASTDTKKTPPAPAPVAAAVPATPAPSDTHGVDLTGMDPSVAPGEDFFLHANGTWFKQTEIPADSSRWGTFNILAEKSTERVRAVLDSAAAGSASADPEEKKVGDFYASYLDEGTVESRGLEPLRPQLAAIAALRDRAALSRALGADLRTDVDALNATHFHTNRLFGLWVAPDLNQPGVYTGYLFQGGLGMPDREYYLSTNPKMAATRDAYRAHVARVLGLAGIKDPDQRATRIVDLETRMARAHATRADSVEVRHAAAWKRADFVRRAPGIDWKAFFAGAGLQKQPGMVVWQPAAITGLSALVKQVPVSTWKDWMAFHAVDRLAPLLPKAFVEENFAFYGKTLLGTPELPARWKRAVEAVAELRSKSVGFREDAGMGDAVGRLYVARHFTPAAKAQIEEMVRQIAAAFDRRIQALDWMAPETKAQARA